MAEVLDEKTKKILEKNIAKALKDTDEVSGGGLVNILYEKMTGEKPGMGIEAVDGIAHTAVGYLLGGGVQSYRLGDSFNPFKGK